MPDTSSACCRRQSLELDDLSEVAAHARSLSESGYERLGNWSLAQICHHLARTMESSVDGFPRTLPVPISTVMRWMFFNVPFMPQLIGRIRVPTLPVLSPDEVEDEATELQRLADAVARVSASDVVFQRNPIMGRFTPEQWHFFHLWHARHHLSFLKANSADATACAGRADEVVADPAPVSS